MKFRYLFIIFGLCAVIYLQAQSPYHLMLDTLYEGSVPTVSVENLFRLSENPVILDTRSEREYKTSHLKGARWVDYDSFTKKMVKDVPKSATIITYCTVGYRSERIGEQLIKLGYKNVYNLYGGIFEWVNTNHEVVDQDNKLTTKVHTYNKEWSLWLKKGLKVYE